MTVRRILQLIMISVLSLLWLAPVVNAQSTIVSSGQAIFGESQAYDVLLRGNGQAVVNARLTVTNTNDYPLTTVMYSFDGASLTDFAAYQEVSSNLCQPIPLSSSGTGAVGSGAVSSQSSSGISSTACIAPNAPTPTYYPYYGTSYKKAKVELSSNSVVITLAAPIAVGQSQTVIIGYIASGYIKSHLGAYNFNFQTLKSVDRTGQLSVAVSVDQNYLLSGANSKVNYQPAVATSAVSSLQSGLAPDSATTAYIQGIGNQGQIVKTASQLAPGESFSVKGTFATNWWLLHGTGLLQLLICLLIVMFGVYLYIRRQSRRPLVAKPTVATTLHWKQNLPLAAVVNRFGEYFRQRRIRPMFIGWLCVLLNTVIATGAGWLIYLARNASYNGDSFTSVWWYPVLMVLAVTTAGLALVLVTFGLPVWYGYKQGLKGVIKILLHELMLSIGLVIVLVITVAISNSSSTATYNIGGVCTSGLCTTTSSPPMIRN